MSRTIKNPNPTLEQTQAWLAEQQEVLKDRKAKLAEYEKDPALGKEAYDMRKSISKLSQQVSKVLIDLTRFNDEKRLTAELDSTRREIRTCRTRINDLDGDITDMNRQLHEEQDDSSYGWLELNELQAELSRECAKLRELTQYETEILKSMERYGFTS